MTTHARTTKTRLALALAALLAAAPFAGAHEGGHTPIPENAAKEVAGMVAGKLSEKDRGLGFGKLDASWKQLPATAISIRKKGQDYYIVDVTHAGEKRTLSILMSSAGEVYDANFTGTFPGITP